MEEFRGGGCEEDSANLYKSVYGPQHNATTPFPYKWTPNDTSANGNGTMLWSNFECNVNHASRIAIQTFTLFVVSIALILR